MNLRGLAAVSGLIAIAGVLAVGSVAQAPADPKTPPVRQESVSRLTIEVTGGDKDAPIENASVYLKQDKKLELNVKTNRAGIAHIPDPPSGKLLIQVVAEGWKTYGRWIEVTDPKQVVKVHLERPPRWY